MPSASPRANSVTNSQRLPLIALRAQGCRCGGRMSKELSLARAIARTWIVVVGLLYCYDILRDAGGSLNSNGRPLGDDYVNYWSGAYLAWHGRIAEIYNWPVYHAFQQGIVGDKVEIYLYAYPPVLLILTAPLAVMPYLPGLAAWLVAGWLCF